MPRQPVRAVFALSLMVSLAVGVPRRACAFVPLTGVPVLRPDLYTLRDRTVLTEHPDGEPWPPPLKKDGTPDMRFKENRVALGPETNSSMISWWDHVSDGSTKARPLSSLYDSVVEKLRSYVWETPATHRKYKGKGVFNVVARISVLVGRLVVEGARLLGQAAYFVLRSSRGVPAFLAQLAAPPFQVNFPPKGF